MRKQLKNGTEVSIRRSRPEDGNRVIEIWRAAVDATHDFLAPHDRHEIEQMVKDFLPKSPLWLAVDRDDRPVGFMLLDKTKMEALFIDPAWRGMGVGRALVQQGLALHATMTTDVNEQNEQAVGFYQRVGFVPIGRSELDAQGRPYPLIHLRFRGPT